MEKNLKKYGIGLDIGTSSVGWACVDLDNYKILRRGNKSLWGVRLFDSAETAVNRRVSRGTRRRFDRRRKRIKLLREIFNDEINKVDKDFYKKLNGVFYSNLDTHNEFIKFSKQEYKDIYHKYKTIYHLRNELINNPSKADIRLVYLAIHHIIKYRGNFNCSNQDFDIKNIDISEDIKNIFDHYEFMYDEEDIASIINGIFVFSKQDKQKNIKSSFEKIGFSKIKASEISKMLVGNKFSLCKLFDLEKNDDLDSISFSSSDYEDKYDKILNLINDNEYVLELFKKLYNNIYLKNIFNGTNCCGISDFMVFKYQEHSKDLRLLKTVLRCDKKLFNKVFRSSLINNKYSSCLYEQYVKNNITADEFYNNLKSILSNSTNILKDEILSRIDNDKFMPRITSTDNSVFPYQLNKNDLVKIIENQGRYYEFLKESVNGEYKLVKLLTFKIPYYVGPLVSSNQSKNAWLVKNELYKKEIITPYNFDMVVDKESTAEEFIKRMVGKCSYLTGMYAIPSESILYSKFKVIQELKQISVGDVRLNFEQVNDIYENLFLKKVKVTGNDFENYIRASKDILFGEIKGYSDDNKFANSMKSYIDFFGSDGIFVNTIYKEEDAENIIRDITIFEDKQLLEERLRRLYPELDDNKISVLLKKKYKGWSSLSKELLLDVKFDNQSIMDLLLNTNENFMQIINNKKYNFQDKFNEINKIKNTKCINYNLVESLACSPSVKRGIYQALKIVEEIVDYIGYQPFNISLEMARSTDEKKRTLKRKEKILELYGKVDFTTKIELLSELKDFENNDLSNEKLFLYFMQHGKCLYSGEQINLHKLMTDEYEVDHILPRCLIKDDSLDNKALVISKCNQDKKDSLVVPNKFRSSCMSYWKFLRKNGFISEKKFKNLNRDYFSKESIEGFINRQLVETRQISKHVANILQSFYSDSKIIYLHANLSSNYRNKFELYKFRNLNDFHHAHDAYLACVLGYYQEYYLNKNIDYSSLKELAKEFAEKGKYRELKYGFVINSLDNSIILNNKRTGEVFDNICFNKTVEDTLYRNDIFVSKKTEIRTGEFYNQTKNIKGKSGVALKDNLDTKLYGSYTSLNPSYGAIIKFTKKNKTFTRIIGIPIVLLNKSKAYFDYYIRNLLNLGYSDTYEILSRNNKILKIPFYSKIIWDNQVCLLVGATDKVEVCNGKQFFIDKDNMKKWKYSLYILCNKYKYNDSILYKNDLIEILTYVVSKMSTEYDLYFNLIDNLKEMINFDDLESLSIDTLEGIVLQLFNLLKCNSNNANFKFLNDKFSSAFGKKHGRTISSGKIYYQSYTGLKDKYYEF